MRSSGRFDMSPRKIVAWHLANFGKRAIGGQVLAGNDAMRITRCQFAVFAMSLALSATEVAAADTGKIDVELNSLQASDAGCRAVFVLHNGLANALDKLTLSVVTFDTQARATQFLSLDVGALPANKTRVLRFELGKNVACTDISRLVLDDVIDCAGGDMNPSKCLGVINLTSRAGVPFDS
jgi:hypothetical protein